MGNYVLMALIATLGTWFITALGAATVVFFKSRNSGVLNFMLGFASGVMIAASFWSLLQPAIESAKITSSLPACLVATFGFLFGAIFMWGLDKTIFFTSRTSTNTTQSPDKRLNRIMMLILSITLHNIPEGLAVGVAFGSLNDRGFSPENLAGAISIAIGIGLQNFPEGAAVSVPLRREGYSRRKSFMLGQATGLVEPIAGVIGALTVVYVKSVLPYALSFAAGAMVLVAVHELIPESQKNQKVNSYLATTGIMLGFAVMMLLDVMLG